MTKGNKFLNVLPSAALALIAALVLSGCGPTPINEMQVDAEPLVNLSIADLAFRLGRLAALYLDSADRETVQRLQAWHTSWASGRMRSLSAGQVNVITALEAQYLEQRLAVAQELAERLAGADL